MHYHARNEGCGMMWPGTLHSERFLVVSGVNHGHPNTVLGLWIMMTMFYSVRTWSLEHGHPNSREPCHPRNHHDSN